MQKNILILNFRYDGFSGTQLKVVVAQIAIFKARSGGRPDATESFESIQIETRGGRLVYTGNEVQSYREYVDTV